MTKSILRTGPTATLVAALLAGTAMAGGTEFSANRTTDTVASDTLSTSGPVSTLGEETLIPGTNIHWIPGYAGAMPPDAEAAFAGSSAALLSKILS